MESVLVTGANGFIGSHLCVSLVERGYNVYAFVRDNKTNNNKLKEYISSGKVELIKGDVTTVDTATLPNVDYIFHIAGKVSVWGKLKDFEEVNLGGTTRFLEYAKRVNAKCFTYISSVAVYGFYGYKNIEETGEKKPFKNPYSLSKLKTENFVKKFGKENNLNYCIIRPGNVYGEYDYTSSHEIYTRVKNGKMLICANGKYESCFVYVKNLVEAMIFTAITPSARNTDYNVSDNNQTLREYLTKVAKAFNVKPKFKNFPKPLAKMTAALVEGVYHLFCIKKAPLITRFSVYQNCEDYSFSIKKLLNAGYRPVATCEEGIKNTAEWINSLAEQKK